MTVQELRDHFNNKVITLSYIPETYEVDAETYLNVCDHILRGAQAIPIQGILRVSVAVGKTRGILFKGIELILKR